MIFYKKEYCKTDTLSIADTVLAKFISDEPGVKNVYGKSDNASSYHANFSIEALWFLCKSTGIKLVRYDFNEPCQKKDQCDCDAAGTKSLIRSYADADHDVLCAEDVSAAFCYGNGMKNSAKAVAQAEEKSTLSGIKIPKITQYHSFEFHDTHMVMWRYFSIYKSVVWKYNPNL